MAAKKRDRRKEKRRPAEIRHRVQERAGLDKARSAEIATPPDDATLRNAGSDWPPAS